MDYKLWKNSDHVVFLLNHFYGMEINEQVFCSIWLKILLFPMTTQMPHRQRLMLTIQIIYHHGCVLSMYINADINTHPSIYFSQIQKCTCHGPLFFIYLQGFSSQSLRTSRNSSCSLFCPSRWEEHSQIWFSKTRTLTGFYFISLYAFSSSSWFFQPIACMSTAARIILSGSARSIPCMTCTHSLCYSCCIAQNSEFLVMAVVS